jgi:uncharacterized protein with von Willebrand factor type A (vWA) domain
MLDDTPNTANPSDRGLLENIVRFSFMLRENGILISLPDVMDAIRGMALIDISDRTAFQCLLRTNLLCRQEDIAPFDNLFCNYFLPESQSARMTLSSDERNAEAETQTSSALIRQMTALRSLDASALPPLRQNNMQYSPDSSWEAGETRTLRFTESKALHELIHKLLQPLVNRISRRFKYTIRGHEINLRRMLRKNMQYGGELLLLDYKKRKRKRRRIIFLGDVSGSMDIHTLMILQFVHALRQIDRRTEIFFFSTEITRRTHQFDARDFASAMAGLPESVVDWGGGTRIGHCLQRFNETFGKQMLSIQSILVIFSDGWDRGEIGLLEDQMAMLQRKAYKIIWLNPLAGAKDYQPVCQGMSTALPYIDIFLPLSRPRDLQILGKTLPNILA